MKADQRFPVYRLIDGQIVCQQRPGERWQAVDDALVETMMEAFDGITLRPGLLVNVHDLSHRH